MSEWEGVVIVLWVVVLLALFVGVGWGLLSVGERGRRKFAEEEWDENEEF